MFKFHQERGHEAEASLLKWIKGKQKAHIITITWKYFFNSGDCRVFTNTDGYYTLTDFVSILQQLHTVTRDKCRYFFTYRDIFFRASFGNLFKKVSIKQNTTVSQRHTRLPTNMCTGACTWPPTNAHVWRSPARKDVIQLCESRSPSVFVFVCWCSTKGMWPVLFCLHSTCLHFKPLVPHFISSGEL